MEHRHRASNRVALHAAVMLVVAGNVIALSRSAVAQVGSFPDATPFGTEIGAVSGFSPVVRASGFLQSRFPMPDRQVTICSEDPSGNCERDRWDDKRRHFFLSMALTTSGYLVLRKGAELPKRTAILLSVAAASAVGLGKEIYDTRYGSPACFSRYDLLANGAGILAASGIILIF